MSFTGARATTNGDVEYVASRLREADLREIQAVTGETPLAALNNGRENSQPCLTGIYRNEPICIFGVIPASDSQAIIWLLGTDRIEAARKPFLRLTREFISEWSQQYSKLYNIVDSRNTTHIRCLEWAGCVFTGHRMIGSVPFINFEISKGN